MKTVQLRPAAVFAIYKSCTWFLSALLLTIAAWLLVPAFILPATLCACIGFYRFLLLRFTCYTLTGEGLSLSTGLMLRRTDHLEWFRVKDHIEKQPLCLRAFGLVHLELLTNDLTHPSLRLYAIPHKGLAELVREKVRSARLNNPVAELL